MHFTQFRLIEESVVVNRIWLCVDNSYKKKRDFIYLILTLITYYFSLIIVVTQNTYYFFFISHYIYIDIYYFVFIVNISFHRNHALFGS